MLILDKWCSRPPRWWYDVLSTNLGNSTQYRRIYGPMFKRVRENSLLQHAVCVYSRRNSTDGFYRRPLRFWRSAHWSSLESSCLGSCCQLASSLQNSWVRFIKWSGFNSCFVNTTFRHLGIAQDDYAEAKVSTTRCTLRRCANTEVYIQVRSCWCWYWKLLNNKTSCSRAPRKWVFKGYLKVTNRLFYSQQLQMDRPFFTSYEYTLAVFLGKCRGES